MTIDPNDGPNTTGRGVADGAEFAATAPGLARSSVRFVAIGVAGPPSRDVPP